MQNDIKSSFVIISIFMHLRYYDVIRIEKNLVKRFEREDKNETSEAISSQFVWKQARRKFKVFWGPVVL